MMGIVNTYLPIVNRQIGAALLQGLIKFHIQTYFIGFNV